jgi:hypothetical protein
MKVERIKGIMLTKTTEIGKEAFAENKLINFVYVPNVDIVCERVFYNCFFLKKFYSSKLKCIESSAFKTCSALQ